MITNGLAYKIEHSPAYALLRLQLAANQTVLLESSAMAAMDAWIKMKSKVKGGGMAGIGRMLSGESLFVSEFTAAGKPRELFISPGTPGEVQHYLLKGDALMMQSSGFVASGPEVRLTVNFKDSRASSAVSPYFYSGQRGTAISGSVLLGRFWKSRFPVSTT